MTELKTQIRTILNPVKQMKRDRLLSLIEGKISDRQMRKLIADEMPEIGSSHKRGYFIIRTETDLDDSVADLKSKAKSIYKRANNQFERFGKKFQISMLFNN